MFWRDPSSSAAASIYRSESFTPGTITIGISIGTPVFERVLSELSVRGQNSIVPHQLRRPAHVLPTLPVYVHIEEKTSDLIRSVSVRLCEMFFRIFMEKKFGSTHPCQRRRIEGWGASRRLMAENGAHSSDSLGVFTSDRPGPVGRQQKWDTYRV
jgi:hypothetical protein